MDTPAQNPDTVYPISQQISINFSPYEDRLILRTARGASVPATVLLTRRMVIMVLQQLLGRLPELTGLDKTPGVYWQEVLQMAHQQAMQAKAAGDRAAQDRAAEDKAAGEQGQTARDTPVPETAGGATSEAASGGATETAGLTPPGPADTSQQQNPAPPALFLASELIAQVRGKQLTLAFKGLAMPDAMVKPSRHEPVFALPLQVDNVHQLIELLMVKCQEAKWHLPVDLPWLESATTPAPAAGATSRTH
jgi:hypothetical protein